MINKLFGAMLGVVIGLALLPIVIDVSQDVLTEYTGELGTGVETLIEITPLLYVVLIIAGAIAFIKFRG